MKKIIFFIAVTLYIQSTLAQDDVKKIRNTTGKGMFFFNWGYNRSAYTKSDIRFKGKGYDFTMKNATASDNYAKLGRVYIDPAQITVPQFNVRIGYYFKNNWAISFGQDHMKYIFDNNNKVNISGYVEPGIDTKLSGQYDNKDYTTDRDFFHYENSDGLNYLRFELTRSDTWYRTPNRKFAITTNAGVSVGGILSFNDFLFEGKKNMRTISLSGYGISTHLAVRLEFFERVFLQASSGNGFMQQLKVRTRPNDRNEYVKQKFFYSEINGVIGLFFYIKGKNHCNTCPTW